MHLRQQHSGRILQPASEGIGACEAKVRIIPHHARWARPEIRPAVGIGKSTAAVERAADRTVDGVRMNELASPESTRLRFRHRDRCAGTWIRIVIRSVRRARRRPQNVFERFPSWFKVLPRDLVILDLGKRREIWKGLAFPFHATPILVAKETDRMCAFVKSEILENSRWVALACCDDHEPVCGIGRAAVTRTVRDDEAQVDEHSRDFPESREIEWAQRRGAEISWIRWNTLRNAADWSRAA